MANRQNSGVIFRFGTVRLGSVLLRQKVLLRERVLVVYGDSSGNICGGAVWWCRKWSPAHARPDKTSPEVTGNDVTRNEREIISRVFYPVFPAISPGTPLDSRYKQWNCESNLYRVTIALLPPMLNHFILLNCAVSRD